jgi:hypothetical protein
VPPGRVPDHVVVGVGIDGENRLVVLLRGVIPQPRRDPTSDVVGPLSAAEPERRAGCLVLLAIRIKETPAKAYGQG